MSSGGGSRFAVNPWLSLAWEPTQEDRPGGDGRLGLVLRAPPAPGGCRLAARELWVIELLDRLGAEAGAWTLDEALARARQAGERAGAEAAEAEATLARLWPLAFVDERALSAGLEGETVLWERRGWRLALDHVVASLADPVALSPGPLAADGHPGDSGAGTVRLPDAASPIETRAETTAATVLHRRRTCRDFDGRALDLVALAGVLAHAFGRPGRDGAAPELPLAALPGGLECHLFALRLDGLEPGVYRHRWRSGILEPLRALGTEELEDELVEMLIGQTYVRGGAAALLLSGRLDELVDERPGPSTLQAWLVEIGMLCQRLLLSGHAFEIDSFLSAAILESRARRVTGGDLDGATVPIHLVAFGRGRRRAGC